MRLWKRFKVWLKIYPSSEEAMRAAGTDKMKIRNGYNSKEGKYYIQITDKQTLESLRVYMDKEFFINFSDHMKRTDRFTSS